MGRIGKELRGGWRQPHISEKAGKYGPRDVWVTCETFWIVRDALDLTIRIVEPRLPSQFGTKVRRDVQDLGPEIRNLQFVSQR